MEELYSEVKRISVVSPCFNDGDTLEEHILTFLDQDWDEKELILIDDGSKDSSRVIISKYAKKYPELIKPIYFPKNRGACVARNEGAKIATGDVLSFLPADSFLNPGLLTQWMKMLNESQDCGFIYGGYNFVDGEIGKASWNGGATRMPYSSQRFDVRELKTSNYIDGSFPIRTSVYWDAAKKVGLKDGLWNPAVKSLQDWDFWLSVVVDLGVKGKYYPIQFFETTEPHKGGLSADSHENWLARKKQIQALHGIPGSELCVTAPWAPFHGKAVAKLLDADYQEYPPFKEHDYTTIYVIGAFIYNIQDFKSLFTTNRFLMASQIAKANGKWDGTFALSQAKRLIHFIGSDILQLSKLTMAQLVEVKKFLKSCYAVFAELPQTQKELKNFGIEAEVVPFPPKQWYDVTPLPKKKAIAVYLPKDNDTFYFRNMFLGYEKVKGLVHLMPDVDFHVFGNPLEKAPYKAKNYKIWGYTDGVGDIIKETNAIVRITPHDGLPISVAEWIGAGRNALTTVEMPHAERFDLLAFSKRADSKMADMMEVVKKHIYKVLEKPLNEEGAKYYRKWLDPEVYKQKIADACKYDEKRYWERRADSWDEQAKVDIVETKKLEKVIKSLKFDSVLDVGCGTGRFVHSFTGKDYEGCDISENIVKLAKERYPDNTFFVSSVEDLVKNTKKTYNLLYIYTCLQHVPPENIQKAVDALKKVGKKLLLIEPKPFIPTGDYSYHHEYDKLFKIEKTVSLGNKNAYVITL